MRKPILGFTIGDYNGIGPEIILKTLNDSRLLNQFTPVIYATEDILVFYRKAGKLAKLNFHTARSIDDIKPKQVNLISISKDRIKVNPGTLENQAGKFAKLSIDSCMQDIQAKKLDGMITAPINKNNMPADFGGKGHTEYITSFFEDAKSLMLLAADNLRVALVTNHDSIGEVTSKLSKKAILERIKQLNRSLKEDFYITKPKIAVLGLNPHAGDDGLIGKEESEIIMPAIEEAERQGIIIGGPFSPDAYFANGQYAKFDATLAMYHDQGLIPFKMLAFEDGVNFTAGLPIVRTSPDHGTALDIAGKNQANPRSLLAATFMALDLVSNRNRFNSDHSNPIDRTAVREVLKK